jgi:heterotetrameric sarcosine oxidase delta subunit
MFLVPCPHCGPRNVSEFRHVGEDAARPEPSSTTPERWRTYLYMRNNPADWTVETWYHRAGCRAYFTAERHTVTNDFRRTWLPGDEPDSDGAAAETSRTGGDRGEPGSEATDSGG